MRRALRRRLGFFAPPEILAYRGFGTRSTVWLGGRVLEETGIVHAQCPRGVWFALRDSIRRFRSHELPYSRLRATFLGQTLEVTADSEGYFSLELPVRRELSPGWHPAEFELLESEAGPARRLSSGSILVPEPDADFAVISDLDDTVVETGATRFFQMVRTVVFRDAHSRVPFPGVSEFYRALERGPSDVANNPVFYVSRSPWNLYDLIERLLQVHNIPVGPLFLTDLSVVESLSEQLGRDQHKLYWIRTLFERYPTLPFILIGDSGQEDPEIYTQIAREYPHRVSAIYIRDVSRGRRDREVHALADELTAHGIEMLLVRDTEEAVIHARRRGFVASEAIERVEHQKEEDEALTTLL